MDHAISLGFHKASHCGPARINASMPKAIGQAVMLLGDAGKDPAEAGEKAAADVLVAQATQCANFLKALGHDGRLMILCHLLSGPKSVTALENLLEARQAVVSQQLARLRLEGLVSARREGQTIYYSILDPKVVELLGVLSDMFKKQS